MAYTDEFGNIFGSSEDFANSIFTDEFGNIYDNSWIFSNTPDNPWTGGDVFDWAGANQQTFFDVVGRIGKQGLDLLKKTFVKDGKPDWRAITSAAGGIAALMGVGGSKDRPVGYQGSIPTYTAVREAVPSTYDPTRRPGSGGQRYFSDVQYVTPAAGAEGQPDAVTAARTAAQQQAAGLATLNAQNLARQAVAPPLKFPPPPTAKQQTESKPASSVIENLPVPTYTAKQGGIVNLQPGGFVLPADVVSHAGNGSSDAGMRFLASRLGAQPIRGQGDGMSDSNRTTIAGQQPAAVAHEEMYLQPEQVQRLGGAENLYAMMDRIRRARTGTTEQGRQINPERYLPRAA